MKKSKQEEKEEKEEGDAIDLLFDKLSQGEEDSSSESDSEMIKNVLMNENKTTKMKTESSSDSDSSSLSDSDSEDKAEKEASLNDLDAQIAALEAKLAQEGHDDSGNDSEEIEEEDVDDNVESNVFGKGTQNTSREAGAKHGKINSDVESESESDLEPIPSLPEHLLPAVGIAKKLGQDKDREKQNKPEKRRYCEPCKFECFSSQVWTKHTRTLLHRQNTVLAAGAAFETAQHRSLYCRACNLTFQDADALYNHRETEEHKEKLRQERKASFCQVCRKQFTSAAQLHEHVKGKVHSQRLEELRQKWGNAPQQNRGGGLARGRGRGRR